MLKGYKSNTFIPSSGIPQGSNLGPLLFLLYINSIVQVVKNASCLLFADDLKIYYEIRTIQDCLILQRDIDNILKWSIENKLFFNIKKCVVLSYTRKITPVIYAYTIQNMSLTRVNEIKDLGVIFDSKLTFNNHIKYVVNKAYRMYGFIVRNTREFSNPMGLKELYVSFVRSILEYACVVWSPFYECYKYDLQRVQNKMARYIFYKETGHYDFTSSSSSICERYELASLHKRRQKLGMLHLHKAVHGQCNDPAFLERLYFNVPAYSTRNSNTFYIPNVAHNNHQLGSPLYNLCNIYHTIQGDVDLFSDSYGVFRRKLNEVL